MSVKKEGTKITTDKGDLLNDGSFDKKVKEKKLESVNEKVQAFLNDLKGEEKIASVLVVAESDDGCMVSQMIKSSNNYSPKTILEAVKTTLNDNIPTIPTSDSDDDKTGVETAMALCEYSLDIMKFMYEAQDKKQKVDVDIVGMKMKRLLTEKLADLVSPELFVSLMKGL